MLAVGDSYAKADEHVAGTEKEQVFENERHLFVVEEETGNVGKHDQHNLENVECLVLARLEFREEQRAHHQKCGSDKYDERKPEKERAGISENAFAHEEYDEGCVHHTRKCGGKPGEVVVVRVGIAGVVFGETHGGAKYVNGERHRHQESVIREPFRGVDFVAEEKAERRGETEGYQVF